MSPRRRRALAVALGVAALLLLGAPAALAGAGGGSAGFSGGGGGGGGGGHGGGFAVYLVLQLLFHIALLGHGLGALVLIALALAWFFFTRMAPKMQDGWATRTATKAPRTRGRPSTRERKVELAAAEAAEENPAFAPDVVRPAAAELFAAIQRAWDNDDRTALRGLVAPNLLGEWERRLDDFHARGWHNHVEPVGEPRVEYVGLTHRGDASDRVVVKIDARLRDVVIDRAGRRITRTGRIGEIVHVREFWTLQRRGEHWVLASIEQASEGAHALQDAVIATPWSDDQGLRDEARVEGAVAEQVPAGTSVAEVADLQYEGDARAAALDLSLADGRFAPDVLEIAARRAVDAWAQAIDGDDRLLDPIATPAAKRALLYAGDTSGTVRMVVRGPVVKRIRIVSLDAAADPATMTIEIDITGRRYVENRDTTAVIAGSRTRNASFTERWTLAVTGDERQPWRITAAAESVGLV